MTTIPVNLKDCPPFASQHRQDFSAGQLDEWKRCFERGREGQNAGRFVDALAAGQKASQVDAQFARQHFRRVVCELASGQTNATGNAAFERAHKLADGPSRVLQIRDMFSRNSGWTKINDDLI